MPPLVSVCLPARNAAPFIEQTLDSIRNQTYSNWELVIVENCSTDATAERIKAWLARHGDARVRFHQNQSPLSMSDNWNRTLDLARGEFVKLVCADDLMTPDCLAAQVEAMSKNPGVALVACARQIINAANRPLFVRRGFPHSGRWTGPATIRKALLAGSNIIGDPVAVLMRTSALVKAGGFNPEILYYTDLEMWVRILAHGDFEFLAAPLCLYRVHSQSVTTRLRGQMYADYFRMVNRAIALKLISLSQYEHLLLSCRVRAANVLRNFTYRWLGG